MDVAAVALALITLVFVFALAVSSSRAAAARTPRGIMRRLQHPDDRVTVYATGIYGNAGIWNPAMPLGPRNLIHQPGVANYRLDHDGQVYLDWQSKGSHQQYVGPPLAEVEHDSSTRTMLWTILVGGLAGLALGYLFSALGEGGPHPVQRIAITVAGLGIALAGLLVVEHAQRRRHRRG
jgi:hypothetical protein